MNRVNTIAARWAALERHCVDVGLSRGEREQARLMFYAGARAFFQLIDACESADEYADAIQHAADEIAAFIEESRPLAEEFERGEKHSRHRP